MFIYIDKFQLRFITNFILELLSAKNNHIRYVKIQRVNRAKRR